jgi:hypothetical protein
MGQTFDGIDEIYNQKLGVVLDFFISKLQIYYSSSRLTLLLTALDIPPGHLDPSEDSSADTIPLPPRLQAMDSNAHCLLRLFSFLDFRATCGIFQDFLNSGHPLALDGRRHATAASACLKIIFIYDQAPRSQHTLRVNQRSQRHRADLKPKTLWHRSVRHSDLGNYPYNYTRAVQGIPRASSDFKRMIRRQMFRSGHLKFLLEKSAYSDDLLNFARRRVFRFGYLQQTHPIYMKMVIFALAKYIQRVTGEAAEVRACESIWGRQRWFTARTCFLPPYCRTFPF